MTRPSTAASAKSRSRAASPLRAGFDQDARQSDPDHERGDGRDRKDEVPASDRLVRDRDRRIKDDPHRRHAGEVQRRNASVSSTLARGASGGRGPRRDVESQGPKRDP
jgi:hypothetical protein